MIPEPARPARLPSALRALAVALAVAVAAPAAVAQDPDAIQDRLDGVAAEYNKLQSQLAETDDSIRDLERDLAQATKIVAQKSAALAERARYMYRLGSGGGVVNMLLTAGDIREFFRRIQLLGLIGEQDSKLVEELQINKARADLLRASLRSTRNRQRSILTQLAKRRAQLAVELKGAKTAVKVSRVRSFASFTFPMRGPTAFSDSFGARRSRGRRHQGTDLMAACGVPVVAVTNGVITDMQSGGNGGIMLWLRADNGDVFFYAHLQRYAAGTFEGKRVQAGTLIAYNGNSGNARGGACHVHFEWHPGGGAPRNPYQLLRAAR